MQSEVPEIHGVGPLAGIVMTGVGAAGYAYHTATKFLASADYTFVQATIPQSLSWDSITQAVTAVLTIAGAVWTFVSVRRAEAKKSNRENRLEDGMVDIRLYLEREMAEAKIRHEEMRDRLSLQDNAIAAVKQAVQTTPETK